MEKYALKVIFSLTGLFLILNYRFCDCIEMLQRYPFQNLHLGCQQAWLDRLIQVCLSLELKHNGGHVGPRREILMYKWS